MSLKEILEYHVHRFDDVPTTDPLLRIYANGYTDAMRNIREVLEINGFDMEKLL